MATDDDAGFLSRWSRRKAAVRQGEVLPEPPAPKPAVVPPVGPAVVAPTSASLVAPAAAEPVIEPVTEPVAPAEPPPTLEDAAALTPASDFRRFVAPGVQSDVKNAALKKLFADPHFNVMDGLDTYIDDYGKPDPLPLGMLRRMAQSQFLGLFVDEDDAKKKTPPDAPTPDEDPDLRLQPHDAAGRQGPGPGAGEDTGREH